MNILIPREYLDLDEVLVRLEEGELLEKSFPGDLVVLLVFHDVLGDLHGFLDLGYHHVSSGQRDVVGRVHGGEGWSYNGEVVLLFGSIQQLLVDLERNHLGVCLNLT